MHGRLIRVVDNGTGMTPEELHLAWQSHATSKLTHADDLAHIQTLGFRGEALPSIGSVSQATMISRARGALEGARIDIEGGVVSEVRTVGAPEGTSLEVRNLFFNMPVRKKFLRGDATEQAHAVEAFTRVAIPYPAVTFRLSANGRQLIDLPGPVDLLERLRGVAGNTIADQLVEVDSEAGPLRVTGYAALPAAARANAQMVYTFLNGRFIRDKLILRAVIEAYRSLLPSGRYPVVFLMIQMDPERVDVNVHPCKTEVRFREPQAVFQAVQRSLAVVRKDQPRVIAVDDVPAESVPRKTEQEQRRHIRQAISDFLTSRPPAPAPAPAGQERPAGRSLPDAPRATPAPPSARHALCQMLDSYILEETDGGINIIDQHALHERVLYESLERRAQGAVQSQRLLIPSVVELRRRDIDLLLGMRDALAKAGIEVAEFGGNALAVHAVPQALGDADPAEVLSDVLDEARGESDVLKREEIVRRMVACKGAVKAGEPLTLEEIEALLRRRDELGIAPTCPHGRPTTLHLSDEELRRRFLRT